MAEIETFKARQAIACDKFVSDARKLPIFESGGNLQFDRLRWNVIKLVARTRENTVGTTISFKTLDSPKGKRARAMEAPFSDAVKAVVAQKLWTDRGSSAGVHAYKILANAGKHLYRVMEEDGIGGDITALTFDHFSRAGPNDGPKSTLNNIAYALQTLARIWAEAGITPQLEGLELDQVDRKRESRLASDRSRDSLTDDEVYAIAEAFHRSTTPYEQIISSALALLCCAPSRRGELITLPEKVEVLERPGEHIVPDDQPFHTDNRFRFGMRWWPSKGGTPMIKFVPSEMIPVAREALRRLRTHTAAARETARWMEENPNIMPLPDGLAHVRHSGKITMQEIITLFGQGTYKKKFFRPFRRIRRGIYSFDSVEYWWLCKRPGGWPILSESSNV